MSLITVYPSRFTSRSVGEGVVLSNGDANIKALYDLYHTRTAATRSWKFRRTVLENAMRLFGDFNVWLKDQQNNPKISGYNRKFLEETVAFTRGQSRTLSVLVWRDLLDDTDSMSRVMSQAALGTDLQLRGSFESTGHVLQDWLSRPNGIDDLVMTLYVLFGDR